MSSAAVAQSKFRTHCHQCLTFITWKTPGHLASRTKFCGRLGQRPQNWECLSKTEKNGIPALVLNFLVFRLVGFELMLAEVKINTGFNVVKILENIFLMFLSFLPRWTSG
jgi:hypothetical protein